ncbi:unnamed protein product, partial [Amoebophrya sp. A25]|eukprot:GSA25T00013008001.1
MILNFLGSLGDPYPMCAIISSGQLVWSKSLILCCGRG